MLKKILLGLALTLGITSAAMASEDFETFQLDTKITHDIYSLEYRKVINSDYDHVEVGVSPIKNLTVSFRYVENGVDTEYRGRVTYELLKYHGFYVTPRVEYRAFEHSDDFFVIRPIFGYSHVVAGVKPYVEVTPQFYIGQKSYRDFNFAKVKTEVGVGIPVFDKFTVTPFVRMDSDDKFNKNNVILGTKLVLAI